MRSGGLEQLLDMEPGRQSSLAGGASMTMRVAPSTKVTRK
jgi:hypothetical protein